MTSQTINYNTAATEPTAPEKTNYNFGGWYTEQTFDNKWEFSTKVTVTMTLYAKWLGTTVEIPSQDQEDAW